MTLNKDTKTPGRTTRFLTNIGVVQTWEINASYRVSLRRCIHYLLQFEQKNVKHKDLTKSRISRDEKDVKSVYNVLSAIFIPRFSEQSLVSISTGTVVAESEADKVMEAYVNGKTAMQSFIDNRLSNNPKASFFDPIKKMKTPGFTVSKTKVCKTNSKIVSMKVVINYFLRFLLYLRSTRFT